MLSSVISSLWNLGHLPSPLFHLLHLWMNGRSQVIDVELFCKRPLAVQGGRIIGIILWVAHMEWMCAWEYRLHTHVSWSSTWDSSHVTRFGYDAWKVTQLRLGLGGWAHQAQRSVLPLHCPHPKSTSPQQRKAPLRPAMQFCLMW